METKLMQNLGSYKFKESRTEKQLNMTLVFNVSVWFTMIVFSACMNYAQTEAFFSQHFYTSEGSNVLVSCPLSKTTFDAVRAGMQGEIQLGYALLFENGKVFPCLTKGPIGLEKFHFYLAKQTLFY